jgi:hypothetical protein
VSARGTRGPKGRAGRTPRTSGAGRSTAGGCRRVAVTAAALLLGATVGAVSAAGAYIASWL